MHAELSPGENGVSGVTNFCLDTPANAKDQDASPRANTYTGVCVGPNFIYTNLSIPCLHFCAYDISYMYAPIFYRRIQRCHRYYIANTMYGMQKRI